MLYACVGRTANGARCGHTMNIPESSQPEKVRCNNHQSGETAAIPDTILIRIMINPSWFRKLDNAGVRMGLTSSLAERDAKHAEEAKKYHRKDTSGVRVFGQRKEGLQDATPSNILAELSKAGYGIKETHLEGSRNENMATFVVNIERGSPGSSLSEPAKQLLASYWKHTHVWANPPKEDGKIVHSVILIGRHERLPENPKKLTFHHGLWWFK